MPSVNLKQQQYDDLFLVMALELEKKKQQEPNIKTFMLKTAQHKYGLTLNSIIQKLTEEYKQHHNIK